MDERAEACSHARRGHQTRPLRRGHRPQPIRYAFGSIFIVLALAWGLLVEGLRPGRYDILGAAMPLLKTCNDSATARLKLGGYNPA